MNLNKITNIYFPIPKEIDNNKTSQYKNEMAIDVGINNLLTIVCENNNSYIIDGKRLKSINQFYNKLKAKYQSKSQDNQYTKRMYHLDIRNKNRINDKIKR